MSKADPSPAPAPAPAPIKEESASDPPPLTSPPSNPNSRTFSQLLEGAMAPPAASPRGAPVVPVSVVAVPCLLSPATIFDSPGFTFAMTHQAVLATVTAQAQMQLQAAYPSSSEALIKSLPQPAPISPAPLQQRPPSLFKGNVSTPDSAQSPPSDPKFQSTQILVKTSSNDGYNWRKYGQKQVKSKDRSRSYHKCANVNCFAKKNVERCLDGRETEIVYRGQHNHDPPQRTLCPKERGVQSGGLFGENETLDLGSKPPQKTRCPKERVALSGGPSSENETPLTGELPSGEVDESDPSTSKTEQNSGNETPEQLYCSSDCEGDAATKTEEEHYYEPDPKRRLTESTTPCSAPPVLKTVKEPKIIVQSASDAARVTDGYKWRKYGQKFVKGNPNPRSYYRCTYNGCPVRKHVEKASDDSRYLLITYEGKHNHDQPSLKSSGSDQSASAFPIAATAATSVPENYQLHNSDSLVDKKTLTDGKALEVGSKKALESAPTLLSIGSNSSSSGEEASGINSDGMNRPLFSENCAAVPVQNS